jgi:hypothetical protein
MVHEWTKDFGAVSTWPGLFIKEFNNARRYHSLVSLAKEWRAQADVGRALLKDLQCVLSGHLPRDENAVKDIVQQSFDLHSTLQEGISIIDAHLTAFRI